VSGHIVSGMVRLPLAFFSVLVPTTVLVGAVAVGCGSTETELGGASLDAGATNFDATSGDAGTNLGTDAGTKTDASTSTDAGSDAGNDGGAEGGVPGCLTPPSGIIGWWTGDDTPNDRTGLHATTAIGAVTYAPGKVGKALAFTAGIYLETPHAADLVRDTAYTIEAWVKVTSTGGRILDHITANVPNGYLLDTYPNNVRAFAGNAFITSATAVPLDTWIHEAAVFDGTAVAPKLTVYFNGVADGNVAATSPSVSNTNTLRVGADSNGSNSLNGLADEVTLYDRALSAAEIKAIFDAGTAGKCKL
jgi:hypothetical protein